MRCFLASHIDLLELSVAERSTQDRRQSQPDGKSAEMTKQLTQVNHLPIPHTLLSNNQEESKAGPWHKRYRNKKMKKCMTYIKEQMKVHFRETQTFQEIEENSTKYVLYTLTPFELLMKPVPMKVRLRHQIQMKKQIFILLHQFMQMGISMNLMDGNHFQLTMGKLVMKLYQRIPQKFARSLWNVTLMS